MDFSIFPDWLFDWKTGLSWGFGCIGLALWLLLFSIHRDLAELKKNAGQVGKGTEKIARQIASLVDMKR